MTPPDDIAAPSWDERLRGYREQLACGFPQVGEVFEDCMREALAVLSAEGVDGYLDTARFLGGMGRGVEPVLAFLEEWPPIAVLVGEAALPAVAASMHALWKSPNAKAITPFLQTLAAVARRLPSRQQLQRYLDLTQEFTARTTGSIHGIHQTFASPGLPDFLAQAPTLLKQLSISGLRNWVDYGIRNYPNHPERQRDYFSLKSADSRAVLQRERHGTLLVDKERLLDLYLRGLWGDSTQLVPYPTDPDQQQRPLPYYDASGIRLPDVLDDAHGVSGIDRYRATLAHIAGHRRWSTPMFADNCSPMQRLAIEVFEDSRIEMLVMRAYPGMRRIFLALHPTPLAGACDPETTSCLRHRLSMFSRALLDRRTWLPGRRAAEIRAPLPRDDGAGRVQQRRKSPSWHWPTSPVPAARATSWPISISPIPKSAIATTTATCGASTSSATTRKRSMSSARRPSPTKSIACRRATIPSGTIRARATGRTGSASTNRCIPRATPGISTACSKSTPLWLGVSSVCWTSSSRRTRSASAIRKRAANSTSMSPCVR
jgi:hypothetical protein